MTLVGCVLTSIDLTPRRTNPAKGRRKEKTGMRHPYAVLLIVTR
jgi:hypothetical protein